MRDDEVASGVGEAVRRHRLVAGFTQEELAGRAGVSVRTLRDLEHGRVRQPRARSVRGLADALGLPAAERDSLLAALTSADGDDRLPRVGVLGPLVVSRVGVVVEVRSQRQRTLLGLLALHHGQAVPISEIIDMLWGERPPRTARNLVQMYAGELRVLLGATSVLLRAGGYVLELPARRLDLAEFDDLAGQAYHEGKTERALGLLVEALRCWRGGVLADAGTRLRQHPRAVAAEQGRIAAAIALADLANSLDRPAVAADLLPAICREAPLHEELHARWMVVLARVGQQAEALRVFMELRDRLDTELGVEPGAHLRGVHLEVLRGRLTMAASPAWRAVPAQLPAAASDFTGRAEQLDVLHQLSVSSHAVVIASVAGMAGVGKTALAVHTAHQIADRYPDGQLFLDLHGYTQGIAPVEPGEALDRMLRALDVPEAQIPAGLDERAALYRTRLADARVLIVLDNASAEAQVAPLLPGAPGSLVLITSRRRLAGLDHTHVLSLDMLPVPDAVTLLTRTAGDGRLRDQPPHLLVELVELCGRLPLAIRIAAARLRSHPTWQLSHLIERLRDKRQRLGELEAGQRSVAAALTVSYDQLHPDQQHAYRLLGLHPGPDIDSYAAAALFDSTPPYAARLLDQLHETHMLLELVPGRYRFHDLLRSHARGRTEAEDSVTDRRTAVCRLIVWYVHAAEAARKVLDPHRVRRLRLPSLPDTCELPEFRDYEHALAWFEAERATLIAIVDAATDSGLLDVAWQLPWVLLSYFYRRSLWDDWISCYQRGLDAALASADRYGEGVMYTGLGVAHSDLRKYTTAIDYHERAHAIFEDLGDPHGQAWNLNNLGVIYVELNRLNEAADCFQRAMPMFRDTGEAQGEAICLNNLGDTARRLGQLDTAIEHLKRALGVQRRADDRAGFQYTLHSLGDVHHDIGHYEQAVQYYHEAVATTHALGDQRKLARSLSQLARTLDTVGDINAARQYRQQALEILETLGDDQADALRELLNSHGAPAD